MSEELRPCPFCGKEPQEITLNGEPKVVCRCLVREPNIWNTRPIEDELRKRIAELEAEEIHVEWMNEDKLPEGISDEVFSAMYACSKVDFVRFYPFVTIDGDKCFLIKSPEVQG
jgi:hypothetical protein